MTINIKEEKQVEKELQTPTCLNCGDNTKLNKFDSSAWLQVKTPEPYNQHGDKIVWICPDCIDKKAHPESIMWSEIMEKAVDEEGYGISATINTYTLRKILEKHKLLPKTKDGM